MLDFRQFVLKNQEEGFGKSKKNEVICLTGS